MPEESTVRIKFERKYCPKCYEQFEQVDVCPNDGSELRGESNDPMIGKVFAERYDIQSIVGLGGMSIVYKAKHRLMDRVVAIKMLHGNIKHDHVSLERFRMEAQAASSLNHQNIITVYDFGVTDGGDAFFVMDYLDGESLGDLIERKGKIPWERALPIFKQICDGLEAAHKKSIVHRDLKPANVVLLKQDDGSEQVKLVDFGIAKLLPGSGKQQQHLTRTGEVFGSPIYMSPEQCQGLDLDRRSDIYALGCLMYEALTGQPPLLGDTFLETLNKHVGEMPKPIAAVAPDAKVPQALEQIIFVCMAKGPADRFQTAEEIRDQLSAISVSLTSTGTNRAAVSGRMTAVLPDAAKATTQRRIATTMIITGGASLLALAGGIGFLAFWPGPPEDLGTPLSKLIWQVQMSNGADNLARNNFEAAENAIAQAESIAQGLGGANKARLEATLKLKTDLYAKWEGHAELLEKTNVEIANIQLARLKEEFDRQYKALEKLERFPTDSAVAQTGARLKAEAEVPSILLTASKLYGRRMYLDQVKYLDKALEVERKLLGPDVVPVARLETAQVDALLAMRNFPPVRPLLVHICDVREKQSDESPADYVRALSKLGQFDVDQSRFEEAEKELEAALKLAKEKNVDKELQILCLRGWADLLHQTSREDESRQALKQADALEKGIPFDDADDSP